MYLFLWTPDRREDKLQQHGVQIDDFEDIVQNPAHVVKSRSSDRWIAFGYDANGEWTACVYELDDDQSTVFPITAYRPGNSMASIVLTKAQREAIEQAKAEGKHRVRMQLTPSQREAMAKVDTEVEQERKWIAKKSTEAKTKHDDQIEHLAARLREARQSAGLSLTQLSERTGMTRQAVSRIESGENRNPTLSTIVRLAEALNKRCVIQLLDSA